MLDNLNLIHMNGRLYDPVTGRFASPDPISQDLGMSQSLNPYGYPMNNPLKWTDPSGLVLACTTVDGQQNCHYYDDCSVYGFASLGCGGFYSSPLDSRSDYCMRFGCAPSDPFPFPGGFIPILLPPNVTQGKVVSSFQTQGNQKRDPNEDEKCKAAPDVSFKTGAFADLSVGKLQASLNLFALNFPTQGGSYLTQGAGIGLKNARLFGVPLAVGVDRESYNGGLSWESYSWSASADKFNASADKGLSFSIGLGVGVDASHLENLLNVLVPCAH